MFLDEGEAVLSASFEGGGDAHQNVTAVKGAMDELRFEPPAEAPPPKPVPGRDPVGDDSATTPGDTGSDDGPVTVDGPSWIESPWVFAVGAIATAGLGGVTIWSGIDTLDNPGTEAVKEACVGQGTECPEYQAGRSKQLRTNILIGATAGTALLTGIIGIFVTEWSSEPTGVGSLVVVPMLDGRSGGLSVGGRF